MQNCPRARDFLVNGFDYAPCPALLILRPFGSSVGEIMACVLNKDGCSTLDLAVNDFGRILSQ